ncbi:hypothetical protein [Acinetobacter pullicarnis]|uniref:hypothetical protein n=1 Tax=Acinetobacter pullicarnis TaxID=2576829 RepID=UPI001E368D6F|nr:hypothetical protein [Acinetobacter pullicarnis]
MNLRSFHPNRQFEAKGLFFHGDNRGFSLGNSYYDSNSPDKIPAGSVTSRVWSRSNIDLPILSSSKELKTIEIESNPSKPLDIFPANLLGHDQNYADEKYKPKGTLNVNVPEIKFESPRSFIFKSYYGGENHAFILSQTAQDMTGATFVPTLDVWHEFMIRIERINKYMDISSLVYGDGFPNTEGFIEDSKGHKVFIGTHIRIGSAATHLFGKNTRLMWANAIRIGLNEDGTFNNTLWVFAQGLGGPKEHRDDYGLTPEKKGKTTIRIIEPLTQQPTIFFWNFQEADVIIKKQYKIPFRLKIDSNLAIIENNLFESFKTPPILKTTVQAWNAAFLHQDPNEGRDEAIYQLDDAQWKK